MEFRRVLFRSFIRALIFADFQLATGPTAMSSSAGTISGMKTALKYGGPTESLPNPSASMKNGYNVPRLTATAATANNTLFSSNRDSRDKNGRTLCRETVWQDV